MTRYLPLCLIAGLLVAFRIFGSVLPESQPNFQPLAALFFCGAMLAPGWRGFAIPAAIWAVTYPFGIGPVSDFSIFFTTLLALTAMFVMGSAFASRRLPTVLLGSLAAAVVFHLITNTAAWLGDPMYAKTLTGFWQSVWTGPSGSPIPSWVFLRNLASANFLFTLVFTGAQLRIPKSAESHPTALAAK